MNVAFPKLGSYVNIQKNLFFFFFGVSLESLFLMLLSSILSFHCTFGLVRKLHSLPALGLVLFLFC